MPLTILDPDTALIVIDRTHASTDAFRAKSLPVALVNGAGRGQTFAELWTDSEEIISLLARRSPAS